MRNVMIEIDKLSFDYSEKKSVLSDISCVVGEGETVGLVGPNGAGKTTLFHCLCGILEPKEGRIRIAGKDIKPMVFNPDVGYLFQNPDDQLFNTTVYDDIAFGPFNLGLSTEAVKERVACAREVTGISELMERSPHHLSGGEKRMVAIACLVAMKPRVLIYDEPTSNLDMRVRRNLISFINSGTETTIISSHDLEFILETCSRVIILDGGAFVADGKPVEIMNDPEFMLAHGLEKPHSLFHGKEHIHKGM
ncbi:MAG: ABC transporter ATP-binding protein [bacterium]|nr:ABC transporter ATP-binding protein [bacterium]